MRSISPLQDKMSRSQGHSGDISNGPRRRDDGGSSGSSHGDSHGNSAVRGTASTSPPQAHTYDLSRDPTYIQADRLPRFDQSYLNGVMGQVSNVAPSQPHPQNQAPHSYNAPHDIWTDHSSSHLQISPYDIYARDFNSSPAFQTTSPAGAFAQPRQVPTAGFLANQNAPQRSDPYNAVGYIRRDGRVYEEDEECAEDRPYDQNANQRGYEGYHGSNGPSH